LNRDILGLLDKPKTPSHCMFLLANPNKGLILDNVPESNLLNRLFLLCICSANQIKSRRQDTVCGFFILIDSFNSR
jgi:hypothetical protein